MPLQIVTGACTFSRTSGKDMTLHYLIVLLRQFYTPGPMCVPLRPYDRYKRLVHIRFLKLGTSNRRRRSINGNHPLCVVMFTGIPLQLHVVELCSCVALLVGLLVLMTTKCVPPVHINSCLANRLLIMVSVSTRLLLSPSPHFSTQSFLLLILIVLLPLPLQFSNLLGLV